MAADPFVAPSLDDEPRQVQKVAVRHHAPGYQEPAATRPQFAQRVRHALAVIPGVPFTAPERQ